MVKDHSDSERGNLLSWSTGWNDTKLSNIRHTFINKCQNQQTLKEYIRGGLRGGGVRGGESISS